MLRKVCIKCKRLLSLNNFKHTPKSPFYNDRRTKTCKTCLRFRLRGLNYYISLVREGWWEKCVKRDNYKCVDCGFDEIGKLLVHHIDESRKNGYALMNNNLINLITICRPCHAKRHGQVKSRQEVVKLKDSGLTFQQVANKLGITRERVCQIYSKTTGIKRSIKKGADHYNTHLNENDIRRMRELRKKFGKKMPYRELAEKYGMTLSGVEHAIKGITWRHIAQF